MSATEATWRPRDLINCDRVLLAVLSALLLSHAGLYYVSLRFNLPFAFVLAWSTSSFVLDLRLPENIASAVIENFFMLVVGESYAFILTIRFNRAPNLEVAKLALMRGPARGVPFRRDQLPGLLL